MKPKKIFGWLLLIAGLLIISWALYSSFNIFVAKDKAPEIFKMEEETEAPKKTKITPTSPEELQEEMKKIIEEQIKEIIPAEFLANLLNLLSWSIFASLLIFGGSRIAGLGIKLIKGE